MLIRFGEDGKFCQFFCLKKSDLAIFAFVFGDFALAEAYFKFFTFLESFLERGAKRILEKATIMMFTKQASENNRNVKTQMIVSADNSNQGDSSGGKMWPSEGYFKD